MSFKVIQWATGGLGQEAISGIVSHPDLELVGAWVSSDAKDGVDVGVICGRDPIGVTATQDVDALLAMDADCVCYMGGRTWGDDPMHTVEDLERILRAGKNVANATWPSLVNPAGISDEIHDRLQRACMDGGTTLFTSGIDPGYGSTGLAIAALNVAAGVRSVRTFEIMNYAGWDRPEMITWFGFGQTDVGKCLLLSPGYTTRIFESSIRMLGHIIGVEIDEFVERHEIRLADEDFEVLSVPIPAGTIAGVRFEVIGRSQGVDRVIVEHVTKLRHGDFPETGFDGDGYAVEVLGEPNIRLDMRLTSDFGDEVHAGYLACAMAVVNAIPQVCEAPPGIRTIIDMGPHPTHNLMA